MAAIQGYQGALLATSPPSVAFTNDTLNNPSGDKATWIESIAANRYWDRSIAISVQTELDAIQTVTITGGPTGGTFTLTFGGQTTAGIAYNASAATVQAALQALSSIGANKCIVTGGPGPTTAWTVEFTGALGFSTQATMTASAAGLTGGSPAVNVAVLQNGHAWTTVSSGFTVRHIGGVVTFATPLLGANIGVRASSGNYFPYAVLANITLWQFDGEMAMQENTALSGVAGGGGGSAFKTFQPTQLTGSLQITKFWVPETAEGYVADLVNGTYLLFSGVAGTGNRYEGYGYLKKVGQKTDVAKLTETTLEMQFDGSFYAV
jgi:hypothetical protein